jgi:hypothetical protein
MYIFNVYTALFHAIVSCADSPEQAYQICTIETGGIVNLTPMLSDRVD